MAEHAADQEASLADLADRQFLIELPRAFQPGGRIDLGDTIGDPQVRAAFGAVTRTAMVRGFLVSDVILHGPTTMLFRGERRLRETRYLLPDAYYSDIKPTPVDDAPPDGSVAIGFHKSFRGYYHWMTQCLPAIHAAMRFGGPDVTRLALPPLSAWQTETLELLGYGKVSRVVIDMTRSVRFSRVFYSEYLNGSTAFAVSLSADQAFDTARRLTEAQASSADMLYVARTDTPRRSMRNEDALIRFLQSEGVRVIIPGQLTIAQQIAAFRGARLVIGPHGAGLTNILFCPAQAAVYELHPASYVNPCYNRLAQSRGLDYWADTFPAEGPETGHALTWAVDLEVVRRRFDAVRRSVAR
jgi:capsular polysaccharide biosynthesis protein